MRQDFVDSAGVVNRRDQAQVPAALRAGADIDVERPLQQARPGPVARARPQGWKLPVGGVPRSK